MPFLAPLLPYIIAAGALTGMGTGIASAAEKTPKPPTQEDPRIAEARRRRQSAEGRSRGRGASNLGAGGAGASAAPSMLGGGR